MLVQRFNNSYLVSIEKNTNKIIGGSEDNFSGVRKGSYIEIGDDNILYPVLKIEKIFYLKNFELINSKKILIKDNVGINLQNEDVIKITYDEYELNSILSIENPGKFYNEGEILTVNGGEITIDLSSGIGNPTKLVVLETNENGNILRIGLKDKGKYTAPPPQKSTILGTGENGILELEYSVIDKRSIIERTIKNIEFQDNKTIISLDYSLPNGIKTGKLSTEKWEIHLATNYLGETLRSVNYKIHKDYTPYLKLPLLVKNSTSSDLIINKAFHELDAKIKQLETEIKELKNKK